MFKIADREIGAHVRPYVIAEMSGNHNRSLERALTIVDAAADAGADAIKLQTYTADTMTLDVDAPGFVIEDPKSLWAGRSLYDLYDEAHTPWDWHGPIMERAAARGMHCFSTPFDETAVDFLESLRVPAYKIASFEVTDLPLIAKVAGTGKPMIMSTGMASEQEIAEAVATARDSGCKDVMLLHCISSYPAPMDQANLKQIAELARRFGVTTGLSDHTMGTTAAVAAVALGACAVEKHFTLSRADKGPDSEFSLEPAELQRLCRDMRDAWSALGRGGYTRQPAESGSKIFRRSIYFVRDLPAGAVVGPQDIRRIRPGLGLEPKHFDEIVGRRLKVAVRRGIATDWSLFEPRS